MIVLLNTKIRFWTKYPLHPRDKIWPGKPWLFNIILQDYKAIQPICRRGSFYPFLKKKEDEDYIDQSFV